MNPEAHNMRIEEIKTKIDNHKSELLKERGFSSAQTMSRHAMELEVVLNKGITTIYYIVFSYIAPYNIIS